MERLGERGGREGLRDCDCVCVEGGRYWGDTWGGGGGCACVDAGEGEG